MSRAEKAKEYFLQGYACSQAVALAFADLLPIEREQIEKLTLPFGGGLGRLRLTCGAVSGMAVVLGLLKAESGTETSNKLACYADVKEVCKSFEEKYGSLICAELLERRKHLEHRVGCGELVYTAAEIVDDFLKK